MSQNWVDLLILGLIHGDRAPTEQDAIDIVSRMSTSTFYMGRRNVPQPLRDLIDQHGHTVPGRGNDLIYHWAKHVLGDQQWTPDTTASEYFQYVIDAVTHPDARLLAQVAPSGHRVAVSICAVTDVVPDARRGPRSGSVLVVVYSADVGRIVSAYMAASASQIASRAGTVWLRG